MIETELADAVKDTLNAATFTQEFTATRVLLPEFKLEDLDVLHVVVVPRNVAITLRDRAYNRFTIGIDVGVLMRPEDLEIATLDALVALVREIAAHMIRRQLTVDSDVAKWKGTAVNPLYAPEHLRENRQFTSVIRLTYHTDLAKVTE